MIHHRPGDLHARHRHLPEGFVRWRGGECPVAPEEHVELMIRTAQGFGSSGVVRASYHDWKPAKGLGSIAGYRTIRERS
jgi:hypothetical protein